MWKGGAVLKAIVMSHENGGSYCIDSTGSFHFVKGYENVDIGTEITIHENKPSRVRKFCLVCVAAVITVVIVGFACMKLSSSINVGAIGSNGDEAVYASLCVYDSNRYCLSDIGCKSPCHVTRPASP